jgi:hypothetical protein
VCDNTYNVRELNVTALGSQLDVGATLYIADVVAAITNLTELQSLVLSIISMSGAVQEPSRSGLDFLTQLRHLDISHNPGITGHLPNTWFSMRSLTTLDISHTGIGGTLLEDYAAFQELREFRAVNCPGIIGQLPPAWGLLKLEVLEITNSGISGVLPPEWADAVAMKNAALSLSALKEAKGLAMPTTTQEASGADAGVELASAQPAAPAMQQLRVLDLSVLGAKKGGLMGTLPGSFAALGQLQVGGLSRQNILAQCCAIVKAWYDDKPDRTRMNVLQFQVMYGTICTQNCAGAVGSFGAEAHNLHVCCCPLYVCCRFSCLLVTPSMARCHSLWVLK